MKPSERIFEIAYQDALNNAPHSRMEDAYAKDCWNKEPHISKSILKYLDEEWEKNNPNHLINKDTLSLGFDPDYEYQVTHGQRKCWDGEPDLSKEGWEEWQKWERFDYHEERYWRKKK